MVTPGTEKMKKMGRSIKKNAAFVLLAVIFMAGIAVRLYDLTDPPLDFNPTRQLRGAIVSRGIYYQNLPDADPQVRQAALDIWGSLKDYEPSIVNWAAAVGYRLAGSEQIWIGRILAILYWMIGGVALVALTRRAFGLVPSIAGLIFYLLLPFGVIASRSLQAEPLMIMGILVSAYFLYRWSLEQNWLWAVSSGLACGLTILIKISAGTAVGLMFLFTVLGIWGWRRIWKQLHFWVAALLLVLPALVYYIIGMAGSASTYFSFWTLSFIDQLVDPGFYVRWISHVDRLADIGLVFLGILGAFLAEVPIRRLLLAFWLGYVVYCLMFPFQTLTHDYYHLMVIPAVGLSLASLARIVWERVRQVDWVARVLLVFLGLVAILYPSVVAVTNMKSQSYRHEPAIWAHIGESLPQEASVIALTHDYGTRLMYYGWRTVAAYWPTSGDLEVTAQVSEERGFDDLFANLTEGKQYFLVTLFSELSRQPDLEEKLQTYSVYDQGDGYIIYDLGQPVAP